MEKLLMLLKMLPALFTAMKAIEEALPVSGMGKDKLQLIRDIMETAYENVSSMWPSIEVVIAKVVALFNKAGVFQK